jgi:very-short-patch-repair endonuclease
VKIEPYYTADILAYNPLTGYISVVEVDGRQHWENQNNINMDNQRMNSLNNKGIFVIRFVNLQVSNSSVEFANSVKNLLS